VHRTHFVKIISFTLAQFIELSSCHAAHGTYLKYRHFVWTPGRRCFSHLSTTELLIFDPLTEVPRMYTVHPRNSLPLIRIQAVETFDEFLRWTTHVKYTFEEMIKFRQLRRIVDRKDKKRHEKKLCSLYKAAAICDEDRWTVCLDVVSMLCLE